MLKGYESIHETWYHIHRNRNWWTKAGGVLLSSVLLGLLVIAALQSHAASQGVLAPQAFGAVRTHLDVEEVGGHRDKHGCLHAAGYSWCTSLNQCVRPWETHCPDRLDAAEEDQAQLLPQPGPGLDAAPGETRVLVSAFGPYPGTNFQVDGQVVMTFTGTSVRMQYELHHVDSRCTNITSGMPNSCGLHIHEGHTCADANLVGGHYFDSVAHPSDPWAKDFYVADKTGSAEGIITIDFGFSYKNSEGRALIVHDFTGARMACAIVP